LRARNVKPGFFSNELLAYGAPIYQVTFAGLWGIADRRGILEDRPKRIHTQINPGRSLSQTSRALNWLADNKFIVRYETENLKLIKILEFRKHQNPHRDEKPNDFPDYGAGTVAAPYEHGVKTVSNGLIPDSGFLIPDSGLLKPDAALRADCAKAPSPEKNGHLRPVESFQRPEVAYDRLVATSGKDRTPRVQKALDAIGGWNRVQMRTNFDAAKVRADFIAAYREASA
jgi:hypothetical protein